ncbi:MAG: 5'/3'-nucleotidase SurE [Ruminococcaceae bacterium]|nr:5'/3'-nucleotidase SurE [Oscillospiraceae bacterium]
MRILIVNDDSISSPVLLPLAQWAQRLGQVTVIVPKFEQSGKSHGIELHKAFEVMPVELAPGIEAYTVDSTPADCVRYGVLGMHREFDLVISGINKGYNVGLDILYSGTVGAIFEAAALGIPAIALSTGPETFEPALAQLDTVYEFFLQHKLMDKWSLYNVNFPLEFKGIRITQQGGPLYSDDFPDIGDHMVRPTGRYVYENRNDMTLDTDAALHGYVSITPMSLSRTNMALFGELSALNA